MKNKLSQNAVLKRVLNWEWLPALVLLGVCGLAYGLLAPALGFYWDEWPFAWIYYKLGPEGLMRYFSGNRPYWGMLFQLSMPWIGANPLGWQIFGIFWRWVAGVLVWRVVAMVWPKQRAVGLWAALLFCVYPGFGQQPLGLMYSHFFIVISAFIGSLACNLAVLRQARWKRGWSLIGLGLALLNLMSMEYFFLLEFLRPLLLWCALIEEEPDRRTRARRVLRAWLPYLLLFAVLVVWRAFFFRNYQTQSYRPVLLEKLRQSPLAALAELAWSVVESMVLVSLGAWAEIFRLPSPDTLGSRTILLYAGAVLGAGLVSFLGLWLAETQSEGQGHSRSTGWQVLLVGAAGIAVAGWPFWLTQLPVGLSFPTDRFTLPFILGVSLLLAGLVWFIPGRWSWLKPAVLAVLIGLAAGQQLSNANDFRRDWNTQKNLFWQMSWRVPQIKPGTTLLVNDLPLAFYSDNSLAAPLNWIYAPDNHSPQMSLMFYNPTVRLGLGLKDMQPGLPIHQNYLAADFSGNTSQVVALSYAPPACLRVLDPSLDKDNQMLSILARQSAVLSTTEPILVQSDSGQKPAKEIFGAEPAHGWCYYFEKADLARQQKNWEKVVELGNQAFQIGDYPNDPSERFPFIEGYAMSGQWERALELSQESFKVTPLMQRPLCALWQRIGENAPQDGRAQAVQQAETVLSCQP
jgi:hypothetical protein